MTAKFYDVKSFASTGSVGYLLKVSHSLVHDFVAKSFAGHDLSFSQWIALTKLRESGSLTASDLCREMRHDNGALTRLLDQLEERGFVHRERSEQDRRVVRLQLTPAGHRKVIELTPLAVDNLNVLLEDFSKTEFTELVRLLEKLVGSLKALEQSQAEGKSA